MKVNPPTDAQIIAALQQQINLYKEQFEKIAKENVQLRQQMELLIKDFTYKTMELGFKALEYPQFFSAAALQTIAQNITLVLENTFNAPHEEALKENEE